MREGGRGSGGAWERGKSQRGGEITADWSCFLVTILPSTPTFIPHEESNL